MATAYFSAATFTFLRALARNDNRSWFIANKARYERGTTSPTRVARGACRSAINCR